eukprot:4148969-Amphidinium_carterae.1
MPVMRGRCHQGPHVPMEQKRTKWSKSHHHISNRRLSTRDSSHQVTQAIKHVTACACVCVCAHVCVVPVTVRNFSATREGVNLSAGCTLRAPDCLIICKSVSMFEKRGSTTKEACLDDSVAKCLCTNSSLDRIKPTLLCRVKRLGKESWCNIGICLKQPMTCLWVLHAAACKQICRLRGGLNGTSTGFRICDSISTRCSSGDIPCSLQGSHSKWQEQWSAGLLGMSHYFTKTDQEVRGRDATTRMLGLSQAGCCCNREVVTPKGRAAASGLGP